MAAPISNQFWKLRSKHGREKIFSDPKAMLDAAYNYFKWNARNPWYKNEAVKSGENAGMIIQVPTERPLTLEGLTRYWGVNRKYLDEFERSLPSGDVDFSLVITHIREVIRQQKFEGALVGVFNANLVARDLGMVEKSDMAHSIKYEDWPEEHLDYLINGIKKLANEQSQNEGR